MPFQPLKYIENIDTTKAKVNANYAWSSIKWILLILALYFLVYFILFVYDIFVIDSVLSPINLIFSTQNHALVAFSLSSATLVEFVFSEYKTDSSVFHFLLYLVSFFNLSLTTVVVYQLDWLEQPTLDIDSIYFTSLTMLVVTAIHSALVRFKLLKNRNDDRN